MCVTNTTHSRVQAVSLTPAQVGVSPGVLSQRLLGAFGAAAQPTFAATNFCAAPTQQTMAEFSKPAEKPRPKRRRKPQKPGKTAKMNDRHFVIHDYHDHAADVDDENDHDDEVDNNQRRRGGVAIAFPVKLHAVLAQVEADGLSHVISWQPHGRCFVIHKPKEFTDHVMPKYFRQTKLTSFQRQLNLYGFQRLTRGPDAGGYYHECFLRGKEFLTKKMNRTKVKGTKFKAASSPDSEPDFYSMPAVTTVSPSTSDDEKSMPILQQQFGLPPVSQPVFQALGTPPLQFGMQSFNTTSVAAPVMQSAAPILPPQALSSIMAPHEADRVLDEAVDELFMNDGDTDNLAEFVQDWDPNSNFGAVLEDDAQLGFMLDKLLED